MERIFYPLMDVPIVNNWLRTRGLPETSAELLPARGVINSHAALFLIQASKQSGILDCLFTNPHSSKEERRTGAERCIEFLIEDAQAMGLRVLQFYTAHYSEKYGQYMASIKSTHEQTELCKRWVALL